VLKCFAAKGDLRGAKKLLQEMEDAGIAPNEVSYNVIINMAVTYGSFGSAWDTIEVMTNKGICVDCYTISTLLKAVKKSNSQQDLLKILRLMDRLQIDVSTDEVLMNCVLEMCIRHRQVARMRDIVANYSLHKMKPSPHTYAMLFRACSELSELERCSSLWDEMVNVRGMEANRVTLSAMVEALCAAGRGDAACDLIEVWKNKVPATMAMYQTLRKGFPKAESSLALLNELRKTKMTMTTMLYNLLIDAEAKTGQMHELVLIVSMMQSDGCKPDGFTLSLQVKAYCYAGELKKALSIFDTARENNLKGDTVAFNTLLDGCIRHHDFALADQLVANIDEYGVPPSNFTVGTIIKMWGRRRQLDKCFEAAEEFGSKYGIVPTGPVRACLMSACVLNKDVERAFVVLEAIHKDGETLDAKALGSMIGLCLRCGRLEDALKLTDEVGGAFVTKDIGAEVLDQLSFSLAKEDKLEAVGIPLFEKLRARGVNVMASGQVSLLLKGRGR
jgi:pentatricopeptide repeat protein